MSDHPRFSMRNRRPGAFFGRLILLPLLFLLLCPLSPQAASGPETGASGGGPLKLVRITPSGDDVPAGKQIVFEFDRPVVPLGRMERSSSEVPVQFEPAVACEWRWLNPSTLSCRLSEKEPLASATRYKITVLPDLKAQDGSTLAGPVVHSFVTMRPKVSGTSFKTWAAPGIPQVSVRFNQPVEESSVAAHMFFQVKNGKRTTPVVTEDPDEVRYSGYKKGIVWLLVPQVELPTDADVDLRVEPGLVPVSGAESGAENRSAVAFHTFPPFRLLGAKCTTLKGESVFLPKEGSAKPPRCNPDQSVSLVFTAPVMNESLRAGVRFSPAPVPADSEIDMWEGVNTYSRLYGSYQKGYPAALPSEVLKPNSEFRVSVDPAAMQDEFGRQLEAPAAMKIFLDHRPPDFFLFKPFPVLEKGLETDVPILVTNLDELKLQYEVITEKGKQPSKSVNLNLPKTRDVETSVRLGLRTAIPGPSGVIQARLSSKPEVKGKDRAETGFLAQITPFHVHAKLGHHNTLVWVTDMKTGAPVPGVHVEIFKDSLKQFGVKPVVLAQGETSGEGVAQLAGTSTLDPKLKMNEPNKPDEPMLFVSCRKGGDTALLPIRYDFEVPVEGVSDEYIDQERLGLYGHVTAWGATAQGIYRAGDTVQYKIYVRDQGNLKFAAAPRAEYSLKVTDPMEKVVHERKGVMLSDFGAFSGEFPVPRNGAVGWYRFTLTADFSKDSWEPLRVLVSDFTPSPFKVAVDLHGDLFKTGDEVKATTRATMHAGGPFANASTGLTAIIEGRAFQSQNAKARGFQFDTTEKSKRHETPSSQTVYQGEGQLNAEGILESAFTIPDTPVLYGNLMFESAVHDERGKSVSNRSSAAFAGRDRYIGLQMDDFTLREDKLATVRAIVVGERGNPVSGVAVNIRVERRETKASRVKGAGNAYVTEYSEEWIEDATSSGLVSAEDPIEYTFTPKKSGSVRIIAGIEDTQERPIETTLWRWTLGKSPVLWKTVPGNTLNVTPEKTEYKVGETARFMVQNPFPGAKALISVERYGVMRSWTKVFETASEVVEFPVQPDDLPGFYLSVVVASPRVEKPMLAGSDDQDLGKPAFRMGYAEITVKDPYKELVIQAKSDREIYKPREEVTLELTAKPRHAEEGKPLPPIELAVAVLDEAVFDLLSQGRNAFDPYGGFYKLGSLDLANYNLIMQLVGRQKLEKKGENPGGGGGPDLGMRSVFKFVSYWNPSVVVDGEGKATVKFTLPDNLTGWHILVMGVTPDDLMGLGEGALKVNQPTEIRPVLPNRLTEGDSVEAGFSIMNRTAGARTLDVVLKAEGPIEGSPREVTQQLTLEPHARTTVRFPLKTLAPGEITLTATAGDATDRDAVRLPLSVSRKESPETVASYGTGTAAEMVEALDIPTQMKPGSANIRVTMAPSLIGNLDGAFAYIRDYPFTCWEQRITRAVMASAAKTLQPYLGKTFSWPGMEKVPGEILATAVENQAPNGGMTYYTPKDEYADPYLSAYTAFCFNWMRAGGQRPPEQVEKRLHDYLLNLLRKDALPDYYSKGMGTTVRAMALAALAERGKIEKADLDRYAGRVGEMSLFGKAFFLHALSRMEGTESARAEVLKDILAHGDRTGGTFVLNETLDSGYSQILASTVRDNSAVLSALVAADTAGKTDQPLGDIPMLLMQTIVQARKDRDHWPSTQDNVFAVKAMLDFSKAYESGPREATVRALFDKELLGEATFKDAAGPPAGFNRDLKPEETGKHEIRFQQPEGSRLYYSTSLTYTPLDRGADSVNAGMEVRREYSVKRGGEWTLLQSPAELKTGEVVRVNLFVSLPAQRYFVVLEDPVPGGLEPVNRQLATASVVDTAGDKAGFPTGSLWYEANDWIEFGSFYRGFHHSELRHEAARFYSEFLPPGRYHLSYTAQAIAPGEFAAPAARAEEMYHPDVFGKGIPAEFRITVGE